MIKYYSTLQDEFYDCEKDAQKAEDQFVKKYFEDMDLRLAAKKRKLRNIMNNQYEDPKITKFVIN